MKEFRFLVMETPVSHTGRQHPICPNRTNIPTIQVHSLFLLSSHRWICVLTGGAWRGVSVPGCALLRHHPSATQSVAVTAATAGRDFSITPVLGDPAVAFLDL